ncbi:hypothetical protein [Methanomethylovorans sp.]|uniref:hypothetical protein n=1 Tax=Methanomethylovorans sp. TaxID=2758717 RepID=UPI00351C418D
MIYKDDITILYITASEVPKHWLDFQVGHLLKAVGNAPIISISRKPMDLGTNLLDTEPRSYWNIYMQMLRGALLAKTPFVAMAEDDTLYTKAHFEEYRPPKDKVSYDRSRWSLFTWDNMYCVRQRISNCSLIAPRELLIEALTERKEKYPNGAPSELVGEVGREKVDRRLGVTVRGCVEWYSYGPIVQLNHSAGTDETQKRNWKRHGQIRAYDIPHWGKATDIIKVYNGNT